jgi:hypothetical protein
VEKEPSDPVSVLMLIVRFLRVIVFEAHGVGKSKVRAPASRLQTMDSQDRLLFHGSIRHLGASPPQATVAIVSTAAMIAFVVFTGIYSRQRIKETLKQPRKYSLSQECTATKE